MINKYLRYLKSKIIQIIHKGNKYTCPFCGYSANKLGKIGSKSNAISKYKIIGAGYRDGACLKCGSVDRVRLIYLFIKNDLNLFNSDISTNILHIAPEKQLSDEFIKLKFSNYYCGDLFTPGYSYPPYVKNMNILELPFENEKFDYIICNHVLEHINDDYAAMKEIYRVMKNNGKAILQVPISEMLQNTIEDSSIKNPLDREKNFGQYDHVRIYGQDYIKRLKSIGFKVEVHDVSKKYKSFGVIENEKIFIVNK